LSRPGVFLIDAADPRSPEAKKHVLDAFSAADILELDVQTVQVVGSDKTAELAFRMSGGLLPAHYPLEISQQPPYPPGVTGAGGVSQKGQDVGVAVIDAANTARLSLAEFVDAARTDVSGAPLPRRSLSMQPLEVLIKLPGALDLHLFGDLQLLVLSHVFEGALVG
jgi:hypothetical protein